MHPLNNGSQVENVPALKPRVGTAGYFSESNDNGAPSYPGQDWFNAVIREFQGALSASGVAFDPDKFDHLQKLLDANGNQFAPYRADRVYQCGEICSTISGGKISFWEWYSNVESLSNKDPLDPANRQSGWSDNTKPFYWTPYKKSRPGAPLWPWMSMTFPEGTLNVLGNSVPAAVFWRLAEAFPEFVNGSDIDFPDTGGEFFRVLDQARGVDLNRVFGSAQTDLFKEHGHIVDYQNITAASGTGVTVSRFVSSGDLNKPTSLVGGTETRSRNLAFPIIVEV